ncbi:reverse transcriptase [Gossypium australe]|uniref:Reverse transcriptase n=1 Tax=Gossypium australe TaxID=47621 RepID=A0A5B6USH2_9ROSI|nr:reverse transcriptase [Gossypium australe]
MKILSWNVRGLGRLQTVMRLKNKPRAINPRTLFLIETKLSAKKMEKVRLKCGFENGIDIGAMGSRGGLSLGWRGNSLINLKSFSFYHIDVEVQDKECGTKWRLTGFYGKIRRFYGNPDERGRRESWNLLRKLSSDQDIPWVVIGDFNEITSSFEKKGGRRRSDRQMMAFRTILEDCKLNDLGFKCHWFTWERGRQKSTNIRERLDRGVATLNWLELFSNHKVEHLNHSFSDHCPVLLDTMGGERNVQGYKAQSFQSKEEKKNRVCLEDRLNCLYNEDVLNDNLAEIVEIQLGLNLEADKEELFWEQRARVNWVKHGDRNTSFFHKMAGQRQFRGRISELEDEFGTLITEKEEMVKIASTSEVGLHEHLFGLVKRRVTASMNESLLKQFTKEEICQAVKAMPPLKAHGVDDFAAIFFQKYWHIVGADISNYCLAILNGQIEIRDINRTRIVLIPKVDKPKNMSQFRPISLCNVLYKIIAKVLVNRMSDILGDYINESQGAFIPGRLISDNVLIAYEILHSLKMKKHGKKGNFALKLDMSKAYDRVEWDFLAGMMNSLGFHNEWIVLVMRCVCSVSYSVSLNGMSSDWFSPLRGLRQGDPLRARTVQEVIKEYERNAGQWVNYDKSLIYFDANVSDKVKGEITGLLGVRVASSSEKYLGLPMMVGRSKMWAFNTFIDRFRKRVEGWSLCYLSMGGKEATPIYAMQCFIFPKKLCDKLEIIMNRFWWANNKTLRGIHWSCWDMLCLLKYEGAKVGSYPSFTWRSICNARELIAEGMVWRVGSREHVNIWNDPWLPGREHNKISGHDINTKWTTVNQLMEADKYTWNRELIGKTEDTLVWKYEGSGEYTVKSGYRVLAAILGQSKNYSPLEDVYKVFYKALWSLNIPSKIKIHNWRLFDNMLPHYSNLARRRLSVDSVCPLCKEALEDSSHLLWDCNLL